MKPLLHENPSTGSRVVPCRRTDRQTDMTKLLVAFRYFANAPNLDLFQLPTEIQTGRKKEHGTTEEEMEGPTTL